jgi:hypothetical protein
MIVATNLYLKMPASTEGGRQVCGGDRADAFAAPVNARIYGTDYVVVVSPVDGKIQMTDVRHTYLHYVIEPLLEARANAIDRTQPLSEGGAGRSAGVSLPLRHGAADDRVPDQGD